MSVICSKLTIKTPEQRQWHHFEVFLANFEQIWYIVLVFPLLNLSVQVNAALVNADNFFNLFAYSSIQIQILQIHFWKTYDFQIPSSTFLNVTLIQQNIYWEFSITDFLKIDNVSKIWAIQTHNVSIYMSKYTCNLLLTSV